MPSRPSVSPGFLTVKRAVTAAPGPAGGVGVEELSGELPAPCFSGPHSDPGGDTICPVTQKKHRGVGT